MRIHFSFTGITLLTLAFVAASATTAFCQAPDSTPSASEPQNPSTSAPPPATTPQSSAPGTSSSSGQAPTSPNAQAQNGEDDNPLGLSDDQKNQLRPIVTEETQQLEAVRNDNSLTADQKIAKINQIRETASPKIKAILTPAQLQKLAEMQRSRQQQQQQSTPQR